MATDALRARFDGTAFARKALDAAAGFWFGVAAIGQVLFAISVAVFYGHATLRGHGEAFNRSMTHGYVAGDAVGNAVVGIHLAVAVVVMLGGLLQFVPVVRRRFPRVHRWNGRVYLTTAVVASVAGLVMVWTRGTAGDLSQRLGITLDAALILGCAAMALHRARTRDFAAHRRWALRLFMVVSAVWFFRVGVAFWIGVNGGPVGFDPSTFEGPFLTFMAFAQTLVPLALLELYLRAKAEGSSPTRLATAAVLVVATIAMGLGIAAAAAGSWVPRMHVRDDRLTDVVERVFLNDGLEAGTERYRVLRAQGFPALYEREGDTNALGYQFLRTGRTALAVRVLELNVETHPTSANAWDSLGEAQAIAGRRDDAIASYRRARALDPSTASATAALERLER